MKSITTAVLFTVLSLAAKAADAQCQKWNSAISTCDTHPASCVSGAPPLTFPQQRWYFYKLYTDDPQKACENHYDYTPQKNNLVVAVPINATTVGCQLDANGNNQIDSNEDYWHTILYLDDVTREPMCERTPNGPYAHLGTAGIDGGSFSSSQRSSIKTSNIRSLGSLRSDVGPARPPQLVAGEVDALSLTMDWMWGYENDIIVPLIGGNVGPHANIDHIIPRKDIYGCDCGPNSFANALVISWNTNVSMSNNSQDARRQAILQKYSTP